MVLGPTEDESGNIWQIYIWIAHHFQESKAVNIQKDIYTRLLITILPVKAKIKKKNLRIAQMSINRELVE